MRKLLFAAVAVAIIALQPNLAVAQRIAGPIKAPVTATAPVTTTYGTINVLQTIPATATTAGLPAGIQDTSGCLIATGAGRVAPNGTNPTITFVGNVLCLDPGPDGTFASYATGCPAGTTPVVEGIKLIKTELRSPKCPDVYPGGTWIQTPATTGIRTWWPLKHTPCETTFTLRVEFACISTAGANRGQVVSVRENVWTFKVTVTPATLAWVLQALHVQALGVGEVPCITDEGLFTLLLAQADAIRTAAAANNILAFNTALDTMEATIVARCLFLVSVAQVTRDSSGNITAILPFTLFPNGGPWGNYTVGAFGWGIVDTLENPCCCKLITDLYWLKQAIIGNNDP